jgi:hypothetical protein
MAATEFTYRNTEFEMANGLMLGGWPVLAVDVSYDGGAYQVEAVRFDATDETAPVCVFDFIKLWAAEDVAKVDSFLRRARLAEMIKSDETRSADRAEWRQQFLPAAE